MANLSLLNDLLEYFKDLVLVCFVLFSCAVPYGVELPLSDPAIVVEELQQVEGLADDLGVKALTVDNLEKADSVDPFAEAIHIEPPFVQGEKRPVLRASFSCALDVLNFLDDD